MPQLSPPYPGPSLPTQTHTSPTKHGIRYLMVLSASSNAKVNTNMVVMVNMAFLISEEGGETKKTTPPPIQKKTPLNYTSELHCITSASDKYASYILNIIIKIANSLSILFIYLFRNLHHIPIL